MQVDDLAKYRTVNVFGLKIHALNMDEVLSICEEHISKKTLLLLGVVNVAKIVNCHRIAELRKSLAKTDIILADGLPIIWLSRLIGDPLPKRVAGIDIMYQLLMRSSKKNYSIFFLGAKQKVLQRVVNVVQVKYPGVRIAGYRDGYFEESEEKKVAEEIKNSSADIIFVAMPSPKKENFLRRWHDYMNVPVCHGVGGSFDIVAGMTKRAPMWMQNAGLEWLYRIMQEPRRMWKRYLVTNTIFIALSIKTVVSVYFDKLSSCFLPSNSTNLRK